LTKEGKQIAEEKAKRNPQAWEELKQAAKTFKKAGDLDYMKMSVAAKTLFILSESGKHATKAELCESATKLGWNPTPEEVEDSVEYLQKWGLVTTAKRPQNNPSSQQT